MVAKQTMVGGLFTLRDLLAGLSTNADNPFSLLIVSRYHVVHWPANRFDWFAGIHWRECCGFISIAKKMMIVSADPDLLIPLGIAHRLEHAFSGRFEPPSLLPPHPRRLEGPPPIVDHEHALAGGGGIIEAQTPEQITRER